MTLETIVLSAVILFGAFFGFSYLLDGVEEIATDTATSISTPFGLDRPIEGGPGAKFISVEGGR